MRKLHNFLGIIAAMPLIAVSACSGGSEEAPTTSTETPSEVTDTPETPSAGSIDTVDGTVLVDFTGDATAGAAAFAQCRACHVRDEGVNRTGPSLHNIVGSDAGGIDGFTYSDAIANSGITWTPEKLFQYLENPRRVTPGTRMAFRGLPDPQDRANLIAYLQSE